MNDQNEKKEEQEEVEEKPAKKGKGKGKAKPEKADEAKAYVDAALTTAITGLNATTFVVRDGSRAMSGDLTLANSTPSAALSAASKGYVDAAIASVSAVSFIQNFLPLSGGTMTGPIVLPGAPTQPLQAATKSYVDTSIANIPAPLTSLKFFLPSLYLVLIN